MPSPTDMQKTLQKSIDYFIGSEICSTSKEKLLEIYTKDIEMNMPYGLKTIHGIEQLIEHCNFELSLFKTFEVEYKQPIIAGNHAATHMTASLQDRTNGEMVGFEAIQIAEFNEDGKICKETIYIDIEAIEHAIAPEILAQMSKPD